MIRAKRGYDCNNKLLPVRIFLAAEAVVKKGAVVDAENVTEMNSLST